MNGKPPSNAHIITIVVFTVCASALIGVATEALCYIWKIPDMNSNLSHGFTHTIDTLIGALIAMLIQTRSQEQKPMEIPPDTIKINQPVTEPIPVIPVSRPQTI